MGLCNWGTHLLSPEGQSTWLSSESGPDLVTWDQTPVQDPLLLAPGVQHRSCPAPWTPGQALGSRGRQEKWPVTGGQPRAGKQTCQQLMSGNQAWGRGPGGAQLSLILTGGPGG